MKNEGNCECPIFGKSIDEGLCYDCKMVLDGYIIKEAVSELAVVPNLEIAKDVCDKCQKGAFDTSARFKTASITVRLEYDLK